jgi:hypothetical protein
MSVIILTVLVLVLVCCETGMGLEPLFSSRTQIWRAEKTVVVSKSRTLDSSVEGSTIDDLIPPPPYSNVYESYSIVRGVNTERYDRLAM